MKAMKLKKRLNLRPAVVLVILLIVLGLILSLKNNYFNASKLNKSSDAKAVIVTTSSPTTSPNLTIKTQTINNQITNTQNPTNVPTPTSNPCRMGEPSVVVPDPSVRLDSVSPSSGKIGDTIVIKGSGFGKSSFYFSDPTKFLGMVSFYGKPCGYNSGGAAPAEQWAGWWSDDTVKVKVPNVSPGGFQIEVTSSDGKRSNRLDFQVLQ